MKGRRERGRRRTVLLYDLDVQADRGQLQGRARAPGLIQPRLRVLPSVAGECVTGVPVNHSRSLRPEL